MQIILRGPAAGYEAEHTARIFFPGAEKAEDLPETEDFVLAESHEMTDLILVRKDGRLYWRTDLRSPEADPEYALCKLEFGLLKDLTGIDPPWGMMTGVRPVRIIHDLRAAGESEEAIAEKFLGLAAPCAGRRRPHGLQHLCRHPVLPHPVQLLQLCLPHGGGQSHPRAGAALRGQAVPGVDRYPRDRRPLRLVHPYFLYRRRHAYGAFSGSAGTADEPYCPHL